jgi:uncharacterized protein (TIGR03032 family)
MPSPSTRDLEAMWARHHAEWRDPAQIASQWQDAAETDPLLLRHAVQGAWWEALATTGITLLVTREYEHLVMALSAHDGAPATSFMRLPHPSGLTVDRARGIVHVASTRNPNQLFDLAPVHDLMPRGDVPKAELRGRPLLPVRSRFLPGCTYMHDLAMIGGALHANAVGQNLVVRLADDGRVEPVWWPRCIETGAGLATDRNYLQLNSIAAGETVETSFFSASTDRLSARRPGHRNFAVDKRGVIYSGSTREPVVRGLTRPHSARLHTGRLWVDNSGYGEVGVVEHERFTPVSRLPGWTRGLCLTGDIAFVGTSRVIPRFRQYAPGLEAEACVCGVHALDLTSGEVLGSLIWPAGNQIFAIEAVPATWTTGFPFTAGGRKAHHRDRIKGVFYAFQPFAANGQTMPGLDQGKTGLRTDGGSR